MALNLSGLFRTNVSDMRGGEGVSQTNARGEAVKTSSQNEAQARELTPGQAFRGEVIGKNGQEIQIRIAKDVVINARMEQYVRASAGESVTFEVRSNSQGMISLRPLFQNMSQENNALKALMQAGIESDAKSMQMVSTMMQEGMSIGKEALQGMYRQIVSAPEADVTNIVQMNRLQIPVTPENLQQFEAYKNYEHQLVSSFAQVADEIPQAVSELFTAGNAQAGNELIGKLLDIFNGNGMTDMAVEQTAMGESPEVAFAEQIKGEPMLSEGATVHNAGTESEGAAKLLQATEEGVETEAVLTEEAADGAVKSDMNAASEAEPNPMKAAQNTEETGQNIQGKALAETGKTLESEQLLQEDNHKLAELVKDAGGKQIDVLRLQNGQMGKEELYQLVKELSHNAETQTEQGAVKELFLSEGFQKILKEKVTNQWMLNAPENVEKEEVSRLYERLNEQTKALTQALSESVKTDSPLFRSVQNIRENVEFMNQLNQMYTYVQLPLKFNSSNAHGDLYVYTNKRNLARKDGNVSAFLHLDMEHLGAVDVYVAMEQGRINTNFYLEDEKSLDLLENNMHILTKRLTDKGYRAEAKLMLKEGNGTVMDEIMETDKNISIISEQSFDVRA